MENSGDMATAYQRSDPSEIWQVARTLWKGRIVIIPTTMLSCLLSIIYLHSAVYTYTATLTLIPTQSQSQSIGAQLGGLTSLIGINLPNDLNTVSPFSVYAETAQSRQVAVDMVQHWPELVPLLFKDQWDPEKKIWHPPQTFAITASRSIKQMLGLPVYDWTPPGPAELEQYIVQNVQIAQDKRRALLTVRLQAPDPDFSVKFLTALHQSTDHVLRQMTLDRAKKYAAYLGNRLTTVQTSAVRDVLTQSLSQQETLIMMGSSDTDFAAQPLSPAESSTRPTNPVTLLVLFIGLLAGILASSACVLLLSFQRTTDTQRVGYDSSGPKAAGSDLKNWTPKSLP
jgi:LPS O-antigen subunit length determinant protein (WzzB/FepE family)